MGLPNHSLPYASLVKKLLLKEELYEPREELDLGQELDIAIIHKLRHSEQPTEQPSSQLPDPEGGMTPNDLLHHIAYTTDQMLKVLIEIRDLLHAQRP